MIDHCPGKYRWSTNAKHIRRIARQRLIKLNHPYQFFAVATAFGSPGSVLKHMALLSWSLINWFTQLLKMVSG
jgi:hypothetical protein